MALLYEVHKEVVFLQAAITFLENFPYTLCVDAIMKLMGFIFRIRAFGAFYTLFMVSVYDGHFVHMCLGFSRVK